MPHPSATPATPARPPRYTHGHSPAVLKSHGWRTASNSAGYLLPHLSHASRVLDVGAGPGTITVDLARICAAGEVVGVDAAEGVVEKARDLAHDEEVENVRFQVGNVMDKLDFEDGSFDVVHAHQVLQHVPDPVHALKEMRRVCAAGGIVCLI